ncbi:MAG: 50S ribosomal protein L21 [bacterium]
MYAIVRIAGFQFMVKEGDTIAVPRLEAEPGTTVKIEDVLFVRTDDDALIGHPRIEGCHVEAVVVDHPRSDKITVFKFRRRENYRRKHGHRQGFTRVRVNRIADAG